MLLCPLLSKSMFCSQLSLASTQEREKLISVSRNGLQEMFFLCLRYPIVGLLDNPTSKMLRCVHGRVLGSTAYMTSSCNINKIKTHYCVTVLLIICNIIVVIIMLFSSLFPVLCKD